MSKVWEHAPCRENCLIVLLALADWADDEGVCWPSIQTLADKARIDRRSAQRIIRKLKSDGLISIEEGGGRANQHRYHIKTAALCRPLGSTKNSDIASTKRATLETQRATFPTQTATRVSPDPLDDPLVEPSVDPLRAARDINKDESMTHPAVKAYRDKFKKCPNRGFREDIIVTVKDLPLWLRILNGWRYQTQGKWKAKNPLAVKAMLDEYDRLSYDRESIQATNGNGKTEAIRDGVREGFREGDRSGLSSMRLQAPSEYFGSD